MTGTYLGIDLRTWFRSAPLRREWKARAVTFRTELDWVRYQPDGEMKHMEIFVRGDMFRVGAPFGLIPGFNDYFRAPETTIEVSRGQLRIYGIEGRREWIVVRTLREDREFQLSLTKRFFLDEVWNAWSWRELSRGRTDQSAGTGCYFDANMRICAQRSTCPQT